MKIGLFSDLHCKVVRKVGYGGYDRRIGEFLDIIDQVFKIFEQEKVDTFFHLGDLFDSRYSIDVSLLFFLASFFDTRSVKMEGIFLVGNHELYYMKKKVNSIEFLKLKRNYKIINKNEVFKVGNLVIRSVPYKKVWGQEEQKFIEQGGDILLLHQQLAGFPLAINVPSFGTELVDLSNVKNKYKWIFSGHLHIPQRMDNVVSVGSVCLHHFGDIGERGCWILDTDNNDLKFYKLKYPEFIDIEKEEEIPNEFDIYNYYRVYINENSRDLINRVDRENKGNIEMHIIVNDKPLNRLNISENWNIFDVMANYVKLLNKDKRYLDFGLKFLNGKK